MDFLCKARRILLGQAPSSCSCSGRIVLRVVVRRVAALVTTVCTERACSCVSSCVFVRVRGFPYVGSDHDFGI